MSPYGGRTVKRLLFATLLVIAVAACGGDGGGTQPSGGGGSSAPEREAKTEMSEPGTEGSLWTRQFGTRHDEDAAGLAVDASGNVFVTGSTSGALPGQTSFGFSDAWARKYDDSGNEVWTRQFGASEEGADSGEGAAVDSQGSLLLVGRTAKDLGGASAGSFDAYLRKYSTDGNELFTAQFGTSGRDQALRVAVDEEDNAYVLGETRGEFEGHTSAGKEDVFLAKFDSSGEQVWLKQFGTEDTDTAEDIFVAGGNIYVAGSTLGEIDPAVTKTARDNDAYVMKIDSSGEQVWVRQFGGGEAQSDAAFAVAVDGDGNVFVAGRTSGELPDKSTWGGFDAFLRKYDAQGTEVWTKQFGSDQGLLDSDTAFGVAVDPDGNAYVTGTTEGHLPGQTAFRAGDVWLRKYDPDGGETWTRQFGSDEVEAGQRIVVTADAVYVAGTTSGELPGLAEDSRCLDKLHPEALCKLQDPFVRKASNE